MNIPIEICGLIATTFVFVSFIPTNIKLIRWLNLIGSILFIIYGFSVGAIWNGLTNVGLIFVQTYHLIKIYKEQKNARNNK